MHELELNVQGGLCVREGGSQGAPSKPTPNRVHALMIICTSIWYSGTCLCGHLIKVVTSLIQPHPVGPKQPQCIYYGMQPG